MRIVTVSPFFDTHGGGVELVAGALARALADRGHVSVWAANAITAPRDERRITTLPLPACDPIERATGIPMPLPGPRAVGRLDRAIGDADAVIIHDSLYASSVAAALMAARHGRPWLLVQHIGAIPYRNAAPRMAMRIANAVVTRTMLARAHQLFFISATVRDQFDGIGFARPPALMFNGVDADLFTPPDVTRRAALRAALGLATGRVALFVGRFVEKKGLSVLNILAARAPDLTLLMAGHGPVDPAAWGHPNVRVLGRCDRPRLAELYTAADVLILPSVGEGYPLVAQEAMACGLPVVAGLDTAGADPGASAFITGVPVDLAQPEVTATRILAVLPSVPAAPVAAAAAHARATYSWPTNAAYVEDILHTLTSGR